MQEPKITIKKKAVQMNMNGIAENIEFPTVIMKQLLRMSGMGIEIVVKRVMNTMVIGMNITRNTIPIIIIIQNPIISYIPNTEEFITGLSITQ
jgi:hypothetical protein